MWRMANASALGTSHRQTGQACQDYGAVKMTAGGILIAACADGAGSAAHSEIGAQLAAEALLASAERHLQEGATAEAPEPKIILGWYEAARLRVAAEADSLGVPIRQLATTLLFAAVAESWVAFAQIGDGVIAFAHEGEYRYAFWPENGEYANTTRFLTDTDYADATRIDTFPLRLNEVGLLTDGLQALALDYAGNRAHTPFFRPMFETLRRHPTGDGKGISASLRAFLESPRVNDRTDDDKTLILAIR